jgi:hypothetical protein
MNTTYRDVVRGGKVELLDKGAALREVREVFVTPVSGMPGSSAAILAALEKSPPVPAEWVGELEQLITQGRRPPARRDPFPEESCRQEDRDNGKL